MPAPKGTKKADRDGVSPRADAASHRPHISRVPDEEGPGPKGPEIARVKNDMILIEAYSRRMRLDKEVHPLWQVKRL